MSSVIKLDTAAQHREKAKFHFSAALQDNLFLTVVILLSLILYVRQLGFYSDDWAFLSLLKTAPDQSLLGLIKALTAGDIVIRQRPVQVIYLVGLYQLFGLQPLGYHLTNAVVLVLNGIVMNRVLSALSMPRIFAVAIPLVYILLPHYSTDRFWVAAFQATVSITFYLVSLYADLRAARDYPARLWGWKLLSIAALLLSGLSYEVALPLFLINPFLAWYAVVQKSGKPQANQLIRKHAGVLFGGNLVALVLLIVYKALITVRVNVTTGFFTHIAEVAIGAVRVNFGTYGLGLPYIVGWILAHRPTWGMLVMAVLVGLVVYRFLYYLAYRDDSGVFDRRKSAALIGAGLIVFTLGYAVFVSNADLWFTSASLGNRVSIAAAMGVALVLIGAAAWLTTLLPVHAGRQVFCVAVTCLAVSGFMINNTLAGFWITAYQQQQAILTDIQQHIPRPAAQSAIILDGVCLEQGGAYIFTGKRDLAARLQMVYGDTSLMATAITNSPRIEAQGLSILTYGERDFFPYGENLQVYNFAQKKLTRLTGAETARQYFGGSGFAPEKDCPPGFAWQWNMK